MDSQQRSLFNATRSARLLMTSVVVGVLALAGCSGGDPGPGSGAVSARATVTGASSGAAPMTITFNGGGSTGRITSYQWNFKDNTPVATGAVVTHTFNDPGMYDVTLTVTDASGSRSSANVMVTITGTSAGGNPNPSGQCTSAPAEFTNTVWPSLRTSCVLCHSAQQVAGGSRLVFVAGGTDVQNYNLLRSYSLNNSATLLAKSIGQPMHAGGAPYVNNSSPQYLALAALVPVMAQPCGTAPLPTPIAGQFWNGVTFIDNPTTLAKGAMMFASRNPTAAEYQAVAAGGMPALRTTIRSYMTGPAFDAFLNEVGDTHFLAPGVVVFGNNMGLNATDYPTAADLINNANGFDATVRNRFQASVRREGVELMKHIINTDRPWTDMVAGNYTMMNGVMARFMAATVDGPFTNVDNDNEWRRATWKSERLGGVREHAGVLSTHAWLQRFPTTDTNRNRHRVYILARQFLGTDIAALASRPIDDMAGQFRVTWMENPGCKNCHDVMDPMAAGFQNWNEANRYLPFVTNGVNHALPGTYRAANYPRKADGTAYFVAGDNWFRDSMPPGYGGTPMPGGFTGNPTALQWLGGQVAADPRFPLGAVEFWYEGVFGRERLSAPTDQTSPNYPYLLSAYNAQREEFLEIAGRFATNRGAGAYNVKDLLVDLVTSRWYRAVSVAGLNAGRSQELFDIGSANMLTPAHLQRKMLSTLGVTYAGFNNPYAGDGLNYGNFNGVDRINRAKEFTMLQTTTADRIASSLSCNIVQNDFNRAVANRLLFPTVTMNDTPGTTAGADAVVQNVRHLHRWLLKEDLPATDAEIQRTVGLFTAVWNDRATAPAKPTSCGFNNTNDANYTGRAWAAVIAYLVRDPKFLFE